METFPDVLSCQTPGVCTSWALQRWTCYLNTELIMQGGLKGCSGSYSGTFYHGGGETSDWERFSSDTHRVLANHPKLLYSGTWNYQSASPVKPPLLNNTHITATLQATLLACYTWQTIRPTTISTVKRISTFCSLSIWSTENQYKTTQTNKIEGFYFPLGDGIKETLFRWYLLFCAHKTMWILPIWSNILVVYIWNWSKIQCFQTQTKQSHGISNKAYLNQMSLTMCLTIYSMRAMWW